MFDVGILTDAMKGKLLWPSHAVRNTEYCLNCSILNSWSSSLFS